MRDFVGPGTPLSKNGISEFAKTTGAGTSELWAVLSVETSGCGYLPDRRPKILFERHIFSALTKRKFDESHPDISQSSAGGYGAGGANQYNRLAEAITLDETSALMSASWGLGQIMGQNFRAAGFHSVNEMVAAMTLSEDAQLAAMAAFLQTNLLSRPLAQHDWVSFARGYNGPNYAQNNYDGQLAHFFSLYEAGGPPNVTVRAAQMLLTYKNFDPGRIDGMAGARTEAAIRAFQAANGLEPNGVADEALIAALSE